MKNALKKIFFRVPMLGRIGFGLFRVWKRIFAKHDTVMMRECLRGLQARGLQARTIADIGANRGEWARVAHSIFPHAEFHLFEPQAEMTHFLTETISHCGNRSQFHMAGVGAKRGELELVVFEDTVGSTFLRGSEGDDTFSTMKRKVPILTIDGMILDKKMPVPDIVKIDVQGFEMEVLKGCAEHFGIISCFIIETSLYKFSRSTSGLRGNFII